ncbi:TRAP transporter small permease [Acuticoccus mangrovi]|uniref:TRAP transporter small permease protein n=1 Tax=Acuticoccus mangrovi TaxID=2796142 RepID=A0A934IN98_9HYPH|nr:TRAP transporter small permease subunit [Acuticoccus mangrovi]MBJ3775020.1 TRAP transporter small permease [Acuticoccus mangrovi]
MSLIRSVVDRLFLVAATLAFLAIVAAMGLTVADIVLRLAARITALAGGRPGWAVPGLVDLTQLAVMTAASLAIAVAFHRGTHVAVDLLTSGLPTGTRRLLAVVAALGGAALAALCLYTGVGEMRAQLQYTTLSATLGISYVWYWVPLIAGLALSVIAALLAAVELWLGTRPMQLGDV